MVWTNAPATHEPVHKRLLQLVPDAVLRRQRGLDPDLVLAADGVPARLSGELDGDGARLALLSTFFLHCTATNDRLDYTHTRAHIHVGYTRTLDKQTGRSQRVARSSTTSTEKLLSDTHKPCSSCLCNGLHRLLRSGQVSHRAGQSAVSHSKARANDPSVKGDRPPDS